MRREFEFQLEDSISQQQTQHDLWLKQIRNLTDSKTKAQLAASDESHKLSQAD